MLELKIDHIAYALQSEAEIDRFVELFSVEKPTREPVNDQLVIVYHLDMPLFSIELLVPMEDNHGLQRFLLKHPSPCFHHLALSCKDLSCGQAFFESIGYQFLYPESRQGSNKKRINFLKPNSTNGVLIELCEQET
ncbi:hypothetical protein ABC345_08305 [Shouchella sp. 1P09AA]|uniref:hypothetical protein n=1 Tax=unclassified Shouchella TaxID=2893065 RepID=UPI0039A3B7E9